MPATDLRTRLARVNVEWRAVLTEAFEEPHRELGIKLTEPDRINVLDPGQVQKNLNLSFVSKAANRVVQPYSDTPDSFSALEINDRHIFDAALI